MNKGVQIGVVLAALLVGSVIKGITKKAMTPAPLSVEQVLAMEVKSLKLPKMVDSETRCDAVVAGPGRNVKYIYTLVNRSIDDLNTNGFMKGMTEELTKNYQTSPEQAYFRTNGIAMTHVYLDMNSNTVAKITLQPELVVVPEIR